MLEYLKKLIINFDHRLYNINNCFLNSLILFIYYFISFDILFVRITLIVVSILNIRTMLIRLNEIIQEIKLMKMKRKRFLAFFIDICFINMLVMILVAIADFVYPEGRIYIMPMYLTLILLKDSFVHPSVGHSVMKIGVLVNNAPISPFNAFIRNLSLMIWPIELVVILLKGKRIGDYLLKSEVAEFVYINRKIGVFSKFQIAALIIAVYMALLLATKLIMSLIMSQVSYVQLLYQ